jgi:hypothetical protein
MKTALQKHAVCATVFAPIEVQGNRPQDALRRAISKE